MLAIVKRSLALLFIRLCTHMDHLFSFNALGVAESVLGYLCMMVMGTSQTTHLVWMVEKYCVLSPWACMSSELKDVHGLCNPNTSYTTLTFFKVTAPSREIKGQPRFLSKQGYRT